ncbi:cell wall-binding repeat-containing protein [Agromyces sp. G08B096]|uniref:Cell wall-binding repeat-containing protein n=1 Tax=Agromyces sp. G08B096 TaxID=3156399 RepID=A0AAU7W4D1_9MICO
MGEPEDPAAPTESPVPTETPGPTETPLPTAEPIQGEPGEGTEPQASEPAGPSIQPAPPLVDAGSAKAELFTAAAAPTFSPGNLISDFNFFNSWAMTEAEIQAFLQSKVGSCANSNCLAALRIDTPNASWSFGTCSPYSGAPGESAARIIYKVQRACGLSAKVILVTLQKEQGLITKSAPTSLELRKAMGMGCPDTSVCDSQYYGFFNQVYAAARQLTWYTNPGSSMYQSGKYAVGQVRPIQYHPNTACGAPGVYISNIATAALYWYTPYQPNAASLAAGWGASSDPCASYGNRNFWNYYNAWFGNPTTAPNPAATRLGGADRFDTAVSISKSSYPTTAPIVYVTTGGNYPDALAAGGAAAVQGGPLLLTDPGYVPAATTAELQRLKPSSIVLVGGPAAVSPAVQSELSKLAPVTRIAGADRYETAKLVAQRAFGSATTAYLATGMDFPDALSASAAAGAQRVPVLLTNGALPAVDPVTITTLRTLGITSVKLVGGTAAISAGVEQGLVAAGITVQRLAGPDRYRTSVAINRDAFPNAARMYVATGVSFPDALAGSAAAGKSRAPLYVSFADCVAPELREDAVKASSLMLLGGPEVITDRVAYLAVC